MCKNKGKHQRKWNDIKFKDTAIGNFTEKFCSRLSKGQATLFVGIIGFIVPIIVGVLIPCDVVFWKVFGWILTLVGLALLGLFLIHERVLDENEADYLSNFAQEKQNLEGIIQEKDIALAAEKGKLAYYQTLFSVKDTLFDLALQIVAGNDKFFAIYPVLCENISELIKTYNGLTKEQYSISIYIMAKGKVKRTYVQQQHNGNSIHLTTPIDIQKLAQYYYAKQFIDQKMQSSMFANSDFLNKQNGFYFKNDNDPIKKRLSQYAHRIFEIGGSSDKAFLYVEIISYDDAKLYKKDDKDGNEFIDKLLLPFSSILQSIQPSALGNEVK